MSAVIAIPGFAEPVSSILHLLGAAACAALAPGLLRRARADTGRLFALSVFALACMLLLSLSGVFHLLPPGSAARAVMQRLDHAAIFALVAATFTPIHAMLFRGPMRWGMLAFIWSFAAAAITLKTIYFEQTPEGLGMMLYLGMGWMGVVSIGALARRIGLARVRPLIIGGLAYTLGAVTDYLRVPVLVPGVIASHEVFHAMVLVGIACHWSFIAREAARLGPPAGVRPRAAHRPPPLPAPSPTA